jgi:hypothetical protein
MKKDTDIRNKHIDLQVREQEAAANNARRRKMQPWDGKQEPEFEVEPPRDGKR